MRFIELAGYHLSCIASCILDALLLVTLTYAADFENRDVPIAQSDFQCHQTEDDNVVHDLAGSRSSLTGKVKVE